MARRVVKPAPQPEAPGAQVARAAVAEELVRRQALPRALAALEATLFGPQRAFYEDRSPRKVARSGRRAGKTHGAGACIVRAAAEYPGETIPVFERTQTCESARVLWKALQDLNDAFGLGCTFHHSRLIATFPNGAEVVIMGADTIEACDKARGGRYPAAFIDEAGTFRPHILQYLLREVLEPALLDFGGTLTVTGTPPPRKRGPFYDICNEPGWSHHHWTFLDNDALPLNRPDLDAAGRRAWRVAAFEAMLQRERVDESAPFIQREWLGIFADDDAALIYRLQSYNYDPERWGGPVPDFRGGTWHYAIGVDVGWKDPCAFVVVAWESKQPEVWVLESFQEQGLLTDAIAAHLERLLLRYPRARVVMDTGGHGGKLIEREMAIRYGLRIEAASKRGKFEHIAFANSDLVSGRVRILPRTNSDLVADLLGLRYAPPTLDGVVPDKEHPADDNHLPDAFLYALTAVRGLRRGLGDGDPPERGSAAWREARLAALLRADDAAQRRKGAGGGSSLDDAVGQLA